MKSHKKPCITYAEFEYLIKEIDGCINNPEKPSATKICERIPCRQLMQTIWAFDEKENKHSSYRVEDVDEEIQQM